MAASRRGGRSLEERDLYPPPGGSEPRERDPGELSPGWAGKAKPGRGVKEALAKMAKGIMILRCL